jgi:hypothetical protein
MRLYLDDDCTIDDSSQSYARLSMKSFSPQTSSSQVPKMLGT